MSQTNSIVLEGVSTPIDSREVRHAGVFIIKGRTINDCGGGGLGSGRDFPFNFFTEDIIGMAGLIRGHVNSG